MAATHPSDPRVGNLIARGRTADVYAWGDHEILKLFNEGFGADMIDHEARIARAAHASGVPTPPPGDVIDVDGRIGLLYARVSGVSMQQALMRRPWQALGWAKRLARLHAGMHARAFGAEFPEQRTVLRVKIERAAALPDDRRAAALGGLERMPDGDRICHGDMHPGNVQITPQGPVILDWADATRGNPLADVARTSVILRGMAGSPSAGSAAVRLFVQVFHAVYLSHYFHLRPAGRDEYQRWLPLVAAARLSENIPGQEAWLLARARG